MSLVLALAALLMNKRNLQKKSRNQLQKLRKILLKKETVKLLNHQGLRKRKIRSLMVQLLSSLTNFSSSTEVKRMIFLKKKRNLKNQKPQRRVNRSHRSKVQAPTNQKSQIKPSIWSWDYLNTNLAT